MILGLSHLGITVKNMEDVIAAYKESFGFHVLSDAERKGEVIERITGIPNFQLY